MYTSCISEVAGNIAMDCAQPIVGGYTGRAVLIPWSVNPTLTQDSGNPRIISGIALPTSAKVIVVDNVMQTPFDGSSTQSTAENGRPAFTKTIVVRIPLRGAVASKNVIEPLVNSAQGFLMVAEKNDKAGHGSFEVIGALQPLKATGDGTSRTESENGGDYTATLSCTEAWAEAELFVDGSEETPAVSDYAASKAAFEALIAKGY